MRASSESFSACSRVGTTTSMVFLAKSFMVRIFAPERPALRKAGLRSFARDAEKSLGRKAPASEGGRYKVEPTLRLAGYF